VTTESIELENTCLTRTLDCAATRVGIVDSCRIKTRMSVSFIATASVASAGHRLKTKAPLAECVLNRVISGGDVCEEERFPQPEPFRFLE
jgi:hypothetical protein